MEPKKPTYRKVGIGLGTITILHVMKPATKIELAVVLAIWSIAIVVILTTWNLDKGKEKNSETNNIDNDDIVPGGVNGLQPGLDGGAVPKRDGSNGVPPERA